MLRTEGVSKSFGGFEVLKHVSLEVAQGEIVGLPAVLGLKDANAWRDVAERLGHQVFEIPLPPPSIPGMRLNEALTARATAAGVRLVPGVRTITFRAADGRIAAVSIDGP